MVEREKRRENNENVKERLQKILSARGICSRRKAEQYITQGLVTVNGAVASLGDKADPETDTIVVDGKVIQERQEMLYYVMNKPVGVVTENVTRRSSDGHSGKNQATSDESSSDLTVRDLLPKHLQGKIYPIGRLDKDSSGLLLFTNDGVLAYRLMHPKFYHEKEYAVRLEKPIPDEDLQRMEKGMVILGGKTKPAVVRRLSARRFTIALTEGRNRQVRRMCEKVGHPVKELRRIRIVTLRDDRLAEGKVRPLTPKEKDSLLQSVLQ